MPPGVKPFSKVKRGQSLNCERLGIPLKNTWDQLKMRERPRNILAYAKANQGAPIPKRLQEVI
jgi:hypothetical protein